MQNDSYACRYIQKVYFMKGDTPLKKALGFIVLAAAAAAGAAYILKKREDRRRLEAEFDEYDDDSDFEEECSCKKDTTGSRKYTALNSNKEDFIDAARNTLEAAKGMVEPAKNIVGNLKDIVAEKAGDAGVVATDYYNDAKEKVEEVIIQAKEKIDSMAPAASDNDVETDDDVQLDILEEVEDEGAESTETKDTKSAKDTKKKS